MRHARHQGPSIRLLRVGEAIRHALADILLRGELHDSALDEASITVSEVRISPDLRSAEVFVLPLAGENQEEVAAALNHAAPRLASLVSRKVVLKHTPHLRFRLDTTFDQSARIGELLAKPRVARDLKKK